MSDDKKPIAHEGFLEPEGCDPIEVRVYHGEGEQCVHPGVVKIDDFEYWDEGNGVTGMRRKGEASSSVGYSRAYANHYDEMDWGN